MNIDFLPLALICLLGVPPANARDYHVSVNGNDHDEGSPQKPFRTISAAAQAAQPGDTVTVHAGVYRERIDPPRGGTSEDKRIVYQAAQGEKVEIKGSEIIKGWVQIHGEVWKATLPNAFFGAFNPYSDLIHGDWFANKGRKHHTGAVYLNGDWLREAPTLDAVQKETGTSPLWFAEVDDKNTTIWAQFKGGNPNEQLVEINVRQSVFYPAKPGRNYITVRGFTMRHAATPWAPPTAEQIGLIGTHWSKGWIIEDNVISHSACSGVTLGKYGDEWDNKSESADAYNRTIQRAMENGWNKGTVGHHIVRNNAISHCEQAGVVGSLGAIFSEITDNDIHDIWVKRQFEGAEMGGIKLHASIDVLIKNNRIHNAGRGIWMDWMAQGTRITGNLCYDNSTDDLFLEVNHGPFLVDNNLLLSKLSVKDWSEGGAFVHNLIGGQIESKSSSRSTPFHHAHSTALAGLSSIKGGDHRFFNNLFAGGGDPAGTAHKTDGGIAITGLGLWMYDVREAPLRTGGNVYFKGALPYGGEASPSAQPNESLNMQVVEANDQVFLELAIGQQASETTGKLVTSERLGKTKVSGCAFENRDGSPVKIDTDYFGKPRSEANPSAGPFEHPGASPLKLRVWPSSKASE